MKSLKQPLLNIVSILLAVMTIAAVLSGCGGTNGVKSGYINLDPDDLDNQRTSSVTSGTVESPSKNDTTHSALEITVSSSVPGTSSKDTISKPSPLPSVNDPNVFGNTTGNLHNGGKAAIEEDWIYYSTITGLYRIRSNSDDPERIFNWMVSNINVRNGWIYCCWSGSLMKMRANGTATQTLATNVLEVVLYNNYLYYVDAGSRYLYRMKTDGSEKILLISEVIGNLCITEDGIYWGNNIDTYYANLNGQNARCYTNVPSQELLMYKGYKYTSGTLRKEKINGTDSRTLVYSGAMHINIADNWIYYINANGGSSICRIRTDGTGFQKLTPQVCASFSVVGDWVYYVTYKSNATYGSSIDGYYRMRIDGSNIQKLD